MQVSRSLAVLVIVTLACGDGRAETASVPDRELVIGTKEAPPFAMKQQDGTWRGISIDLWRRVAERTQLRYRFAEAETVQALVEGTADGSFDAAIAALTVTAAREPKANGARSPARSSRTAFFRPCWRSSASRYAWGS
jgi:polar amino acid transport system substrate-binding protein